MQVSCETEKKIWTGILFSTKQHLSKPCCFWLCPSFLQMLAVREWCLWESNESEQPLVQCFWLKNFTFRSQLSEVWKHWCSHFAKSWKIVLVFWLRYTSQATAAAFQGSAHTAPQPLWHLFLANILVVYLPSVIPALPFQSSVIALKHVCPSLMMEC